MVFRTHITKSQSWLCGGSWEESRSLAVRPSWEACGFRGPERQRESRCLVPACGRVDVHLLNVCLLSPDCSVLLTAS